MRAFGRRVAAPGECRPDRWQARAGACAHPDLLLDDVALGPEARCDARESIEAGQKPDTLGAIQIGVARHRRGQGLSALMLAAMRRTAQEAGLTALIACVRPTAKTRYPLLPSRRTRPGGAPVMGCRSTHGCVSMSGPAGASCARRHAR